MRSLAICFVLLVLSSTLNAQDQEVGIKFVVAIENGDVDAVRELLAGGAPVDSPLSEDGETPLMKAAWNGQEEIARLLLDAGAKVNSATTETGATALMNAITSGSMPVVDLLISKGADLGARNAFAFDAFSLAVSASRIDMADRMLKAEADIESSVHGLTPIMFAVSTTNEEMIRFLVDRGANINAGVGKGPQTPLNLAAMTGNTAAVKLLIELKADVNGASKDGTTPLKAAQEAGHSDIVQMLKRAGAK